jgi:hypothetical protein
LLLWIIETSFEVDGFFWKSTLL